MAVTSLFVSLLAASVALAQSSAYGQCGGTGWGGATTCVSGYTCTYSNPYYSQCLPGTASSSKSTTTSSSTSTSTTTSTTTTSSTSTTPSSTTTTSTSTPSGAVSCDFESTPNGNWSMFVTAQSGGSATIVTTKAHSGTHSLEVVSSGGYSNHVFWGLSSLSAVGLGGSGNLFGRYYANFENAFTQDHTTHMWMTDPVAQTLRMGGQFTVLDWNRASDDSIMPDGSPQSNNGSVVIAANTWYCIEFMLGRSSGSIDTWVNGNVVSSLTTPQTRWGSSFVPNPSDWGLGWESYGGAANTVWFDDLALGTSRIGC